MIFQKAVSLLLNTGLSLLIQVVVAPLKKIILSNILSLFDFSVIYGNLLSGLASVIFNGVESRLDIEYRMDRFYYMSSIHTGWLLFGKSHLMFEIYRTAHIIWNY